MKLYHTLVQPLFTDDRDLEWFFINRGIKYHLGGDRQEDLREYGFTIDGFGEVHPLTGQATIVGKYVVLLDESDLSAIKLSIPEVQIIRNRAWYNFVNTVRGYFSWFLS